MNGTGGLSISRALGDEFYKSPNNLVPVEPEITTVSLIPYVDQYLILGSDGLFESWFDMGEIAKFIRSFDPRTSPEHLSSELTRTTIQQGSQDNVSSIIVALSH